MESLENYCLELGLEVNKPTGTLKADWGAVVPGTLACVVWVRGDSAFLSPFYLPGSFVGKAHSEQEAIGWMRKFNVNRNRMWLVEWEWIPGHEPGEGIEVEESPSMLRANSAQEAMNNLHASWGYGDDRLIISATLV